MRNCRNYNRNHLFFFLLEIHIDSFSIGANYVHPAPSTSTQSSATPSTLLEPKYCMSLVNFPKLRLKISKFSALTKKWYKWYLGVLIPDPDLDFWNSDSKIRFWANLGQKSKSCLCCLKIGKYGSSINFWTNLGQNVQSFPFCQKICHFGPNLPKNWFWGWNFKTLSPDSESVPPRYHGCQFSVKTDNFEFSGLNLRKLTNYMQYFGSNNVEGIPVSWVEIEMSWVEADGGGCMV